MKCLADEIFFDVVMNICAEGLETPSYVLDPPPPPQHTLNFNNFYKVPELA